MICRNPSEKISTYSDILSTSVQNLDEKSRSYLDKILVSTSRMHILIKDVLTYSEVVKLSGGNQAVDLDKIMTGILVDFELLLSQRGSHR